MKTFTVLQIEDEQATANRQKRLFLEIAPEATWIDTCDSISSSVNLLKSMPSPDLILLDIQLADGNSFEIFKQVQVSCPVIFMTAYDEYAIKAFELNSLDYLLKPVKKEALEKAVRKFKNQRKTHSTPDFNQLLASLETLQKPQKSMRFMVKLASQIKTFEDHEVAYFYIEDKIVFAMLKEGSRYPIDFSLDQLEEQLDKQQFFRINRATIISFGAIDKLYTYSKSRIKVILKPPCPIETISSTDRSPHFRDWLSGQ
ncbi:MAG: LytTR family DNA-binding domain-containing protein [Bacteroidales bacterium]|jgi:DNA-binding LytR/AlgR family response regulator|nr:LytTR family DNA-binding domain-containing protein [Bacteroidales bacterium]HOI31265.1 LytTR family DNA-binding domain-containing protein [Bacteroidales bacterium]